jgi:hypothetical protein
MKRAVAVLGVVLLGLASVRAGRAHAEAPPQTRPSPAPVSGETLEVPPPPFSDGIYPCNTCHDTLKPNPERRALEFHDEIQLKHDEQHRWCLDCHDAANRDVLHLASGAKLPFEESYMLCGQCHGEKLRDWRAGVHGRRTGQWNGHKTYLLCVHCHSPHQPHFKPLAPKPAPKPPARPVR